MSWSTSFSGHAKDIALDVPAQLDERQAAQLAAATEAAKGIAASFGDCHVQVSASGHANPEPGSPGDSTSVSVASIAEPEGA